MAMIATIWKKRKIVAVSQQNFQQIHLVNCEKMIIFALK